MKSPTKPKILVIDDEPTTLKYFRRCFCDKYDVLIAGCGAEALNCVKKNPDIAVAICDQRMPGETGVDFFSTLRVEYPRISRVIFTAYSDYELLVDSINAAGVFAYLDKPLNLDIVATVLANGVTNYLASDDKSVGAFHIERKDIYSKNEVDLSIDDASDLETILHLLRKRAGLNNSVSIKIKSFGSETVLVLVDQANQLTEHVSLSQFRSFLTGAAVPDRKLQQFLGDIHSVAGSSAVKLGTSNMTAVSARNFNEIQIRTSLEQLQIFLSTVVNLAGQQGRKRPSMKVAQDRIMGMRDKCRMAGSGVVTLYDAAKTFSEEMMIFLDEINQEGTPEREYMKSFSIDYRTINGLFANYNNIVANVGGCGVEPDRSLHFAIELRESRRTDIAYFVLIGVLVVPPVLITAYYLIMKESKNDFVNLSKFSYVVGISLIAGLVGGRIGGLVSVSGQLDYLGLNNRPLLAKATGGFALFLLAFVIGSLFLL